jgi:glycosyltransferase involved in cell wall biosynthesis
VSCAPTPTAALAKPGPWTRLIDHSRTVYDRAVGRHRSGGIRPHRSGATRRLAVVTPLPPSQTGIAPYSLRLLEAMAAHRAVHAYADGRDGAPVHGGPRRVHAHAIGEFARIEVRRPEHARPLMCFGNSHFHLDAWRLLMEFGGDALLHEVSLCGLYLSLDAAGLLGARGAETRAREMEGRSLEDALSAPCAMVTEVVDAARRVFVHTDEARRLLLERRPHRGDDISVVPFALPPPSRRERRSRELVVASFGYTRAAELVIEAFAEIFVSYPGAQLWFVGAEHFPGQQERLLEQVRVRGLSERVTFTGWVDEDEYRRRLEAAAVAIQPRSRAFGERSAALGDLLAAGVPTIVNDAGPGASIPADAVLHVRGAAGPAEFAGAAIDLLRDPALQTRISDAATRYASEHGAPRAARELLAAIDA